MRALRNIFWSALAMWLLSAGGVEAVSDSTGGTPSSFTFPSPLKDIGGIDTLVKALIDKIILPIGASVAALFIIYSGFLYVKAQGKPEKIKEAREALTTALIGTAIILGAWVIAQLIGGTINQLRSAVPPASYYVNVIYG